MNDKERERRVIYSRFASLGVSLLGIYEITPYLLGGGTSMNPIVFPAGRDMTHIPWVGLSAIIPAIPYTVTITKRIPKKVGVPKLNVGTWVIPIGRTYWGKAVKFNFDGSTPHLIICGASRFGKSAFLRYILYMLCRQQPAERLELHIIDLKKGATFGAFEVLPHTKAVYYSVTPDNSGEPTAEGALELAEQVMFERLVQIRQCRRQFRSIPNFPRHVVIIDEGSLLKLSDVCMEKLQNIVSIGREPHVHIIYATQRASSDVLPVTTRDQMEGRFVFHVNEPGSSRVVLGEDNTAAYELPKRPGRMIYQSPYGDIELQACYVDDRTIDDWLQTFVPIGERVIDLTTRGDYEGVVTGQLGMASDWD